MIRKLILAALAFIALSAQAQSQLPFKPRDGANPVNLAVTGTAQNITLPSPSPAGSDQQVLFTNEGTQTVYFRCDGAVATTSNGLKILANSQFVMTISYANTTCSVIAAGTGSSLHAAVGTGN